MASATPGSMTCVSRASMLLSGTELRARLALQHNSCKRLACLVIYTGLDSFGSLAGCKSKAESNFLIITRHKRCVKNRPEHALEAAKHMRCLKPAFFKFPLGKSSPVRAARSRWSCSGLLKYLCRYAKTNSEFCRLFCCCCRRRHFGFMVQHWFKQRYHACKCMLLEWQLMSISKLDLTHD